MRAATTCSRSPTPSSRFSSSRFASSGKADYITRIVPGLQRLKLDHFGHDMVVFHEREIRKASGPFAFLTETERRDAFMRGLNQWVHESPFTIIAVVISK